MTATKRGARRLTPRLVLVLLAVVALVPLRGAPLPAAADSGMTLVGTLDMPSGEAHVYDRVAHRIFGFNTVAFGASVSTALSLYDDSGHLLKRRDLSPYVLPSGSELENPIVSAWDEAAGRLYILTRPVWTFDAPTVVTQSGQFMLTVDRELNVSAAPFAPFPAALQIMGMSWSAEMHRLVLVASPAVQLAGTYGVEVAEVDPASRTTVSGPWPVAGCQRVVAYQRQAAVVRRGATIFLGCGAGNLVLAPQPGLPAVIAIDTDKPGSTPGTPLITAYPIAGNYAAGDSIADQAAGRFVMVSSGPNVPAQAAWVFDEDHRVILGVVAAGNINVFDETVDEVTGRLILLIDQTVLFSSDRGTKIPQAVALSDAGLGVDQATSIYIPTTHLLLLQDNTPNSTAWHAYRVDLPDIVPPSPQDPDAGAVDVAEQPGVTAAQYSGDAQALGARVYEIGGANGALQNVAPSDSDWWTQVQALYPTGYNDGDRNLYASRVASAHLGTGDASARSTALDRDGLTDAYWQHLSAEKWPYLPATCTDLGGDTNSAKSDGASSDCDQAQRHVAATASYAPAGSVGPVTVGATESSVELRETAASGVVVDSVAVAHNVNVAGVVHIGEVTSHSVAAAHGRPGTTRATYTRVFQKVVAPGYSCDEQCDPVAATAAINAALQTRKIVVELPDTSVLASPRGARAWATIDPWHHQQDVVYDDEPQTDLQIPALRILYVNDNSARSRVVLDLAATDANASYLIYPLGSDSGAATDASAAPLDGTALAAGAGGALGGDYAASPQAASATGTRTAVGAASQRPSTLLEAAGEGLRLLFTGRGDLVLNVLMWALLATPLLLALRRRHRVRLAGGVR